MSDNSEKKRSKRIAQVNLDILQPNLYPKQNFNEFYRGNIIELTPLDDNDNQHPLFKALQDDGHDQSKDMSKQKKSITPKSQANLHKSPNPLANPLASHNPLSASGRVVGIADIAASRISGEYVKNNTDILSDFVPWESRIQGIISKYTTNKMIAIPSFVKGVSSGPTSQDEKVRNRLEQLDQEDTEAEILQLTQKQYIEHINTRRNELEFSWKNNSRVSALKTAVRCAKLLGDTKSVTQFYPTKFVYITEILDAFGKLVFDRVKLFSTIRDGDVTITLKDNFRAEDVSDNAKETCKNWFYKIASIRELIPRIYIEMSILECYRFIENDIFPETFKRLRFCIRGIGDPLVATYAWVYLARKGMEIIPNYKAYLFESFEDFLFILSLIDEPYIQKQIEDRGLTKEEYLKLFQPAIDWLLDCISLGAEETVFLSILNLNTKGMQDTSGLVLQAIIKSFQAPTISRHAKTLIKNIRSLNSTPEVKLFLYRILGEKLCQGSPPEKHTRTILNEIWGDVIEFNPDNDTFVDLVDAYIDYPLSHLGHKEANIILKQLLERIKPEKRYLQHQTQLQSIIERCIDHKNSTFTKLFSMNYFSPYLDLFSGDTQISVSKKLLKLFTKSEKVNDPVIVNTMFSIARSIHDGINALSTQDERREVSQLLSGFISMVDYGKNVEKQLNFLVEARRSFNNLDEVKEDLVKLACALAMKTLKLAKGKHTSDSAAFVKAVISFCYVTIPGIEGYFERLYLLVHAGQVAYINQSVTQGESMIKAAISLLQDAPDTKTDDSSKIIPAEPYLLQFINYLLSSLVMLPGHPDHGPYFFIEAIVTVMEKIEWDVKGTTKLEIYNSILKYIAAASQKIVPNKCESVESNMDLFGRRYMEKYTKELIGKTIELIEKEVERLKQFADRESRKNVENKFALIERTINQLYESMNK